MHDELPEEISKPVEKPYDSYKRNYDSRENVLKEKKETYYKDYLQDAEDRDINKFSQQDAKNEAIKKAITDKHKKKQKTPSESEEDYIPKIEEDFNFSIPEIASNDYQNQKTNFKNHDFQNQIHSYLNANEQSNKNAEQSNKNIEQITKNIKQNNNEQPHRLLPSGILRDSHQIINNVTIKSLTLKQLKDFMAELNQAKQTFDKKCIESKLPRETLEQFLFSHLKQKYGLNTIVIEWTLAVFDAIKLHADKDNDVAVFLHVTLLDFEKQYRRKLQRTPNSNKILHKRGFVHSH